MQARLPTCDELSHCRHHKIPRAVPHIPPSPPRYPICRRRPVRLRSRYGRLGHPPGQSWRRCSRRRHRLIIRQVADRTDHPEVPGHTECKDRQEELDHTERSGLELELGLEPERRRQ